jgi:hypothetical protein
LGKKRIPFVPYNYDVPDGILTNEIFEETLGGFAH